MLLPVSLSLGLLQLCSHCCASAMISATSTALATSLHPPACPVPWPFHSLLSQTLSHSQFQQHPGVGRLQPPPQQVPQSPGPWMLAVSGCMAWPGGCEDLRGKSRRQGVAALVASSQGGYCKFHKMAHAPNLHRHKHWAGWWLWQQSGSSSSSSRTRKGWVTHPQVLSG